MPTIVIVYYNIIMSQSLANLIIEMDLSINQIRLIRCENRIIIGIDDGSIIDAKWYIPDADLNTIGQTQLEIDSLKEFFDGISKYSELTEEKQTAFRIRFC